MYDLVIQNGLVVSSERVYEATVCINSEKIESIAVPRTPVKGKAVIDAKGKYIFPGAIDTHAHFNDPGYNWREDYEHGTAAAAVGGITTVIDMPLQNEPALTNGKIFDDKYDAVSKNAYVDYCFWGGLVDYNLDSLQELNDKGCVAFKSFIGPVSPDYVSLTMGQVREALEILKKSDARVGFHCEDYSIIKWEEGRAQRKNTNTWEDFLSSRPLIAEIMATKNIIDLAKETKTKVHICHVSHPSVAEEIRKAKLEGVDITGETCSHYLTFSKEDLISNGSLFKCAPPLRETKAVESMWTYLENGTLDCVASDHSPCTLEEKDEEAHGIFGSWGGISGIQNLVQVMYSEGVVKRGYSPTILAKTLSEGPAKTFGLYGKKGAIEVGFDADMMILDPDKEWRITPESLEYVNKISAFVDFEGKGMPICTILRGEIIVKDKQVVGNKGFGNLIKKRKI